MSSGLHPSKEVKLGSILRDTSTLSQRFRRFMKNGENAAMVIAGMGGIPLFMPAASELAFLSAMAAGWISMRIQRKDGLPMQVPMSSGTIDPKEVNLATKKPVKSKGIIYLGNEQGTEEEIWITDTQARTHMMFLGTTGSGKAQPLTAKVLTPRGWVSMGDVKPGDRVCTPDGRDAAVIGVFPQGVLEIYELVFEDGRKTRACADHLWRIEQADHPVTTRELINRLADGEVLSIRTCAAIKGNPELPSIEERLTAVQGLSRTTTFFPQRHDAERIVGYVRSLGGIASLSAYDNAGFFVEAQLSGGGMGGLPLRISTITPSSHEQAQCLYVDHPDHLYITDDYVVTHNTEFLASVAFNALVHGSGLIYVDGKADNSLYGKIYSMCRAMGREDDVLLINFQTGAKDVFGAQPKKMSNTLNPFSVGSSGMLTQLVVGLMSGGKEGGKSDVWENRAISFVEALLKPLVFLRERYGLLLDVEVIRNYFNLEPLVALLTENMEKTKNEFGADIWVEKAGARFPGIGQALSGLAAYIDNLPGYNPNKPVSKQESVVSEQHGYITMQLIRTFNSLADTYGYIMKTPLAEIDFLDVFLNRRILVVLLPALEKSPPELTNLGRIIVAAIKSTMAVGLGADVEGDWVKVIASKPTTAPSPYMCILDEYGYYATEGFAVVPAQARSLGFSAIFAGQDLPAFEKASKSEAESTLANTTTKFCGKLECTKTFEYFKTLAGEAYYSKTGGFQNQASTILDKHYLDNQTANIERIGRISNDDLRSQVSGEWHMFFADRIIRINSFYSNPRNVKKLRTNHFIPVEPPSDNSTRQFVRLMKIMNEQLTEGLVRQEGDAVKYRVEGNLDDEIKAFFGRFKQQDGLAGFDLAAKAFKDNLFASLENDEALFGSREAEGEVKGSDESSFEDEDEGVTAETTRAKFSFDNLIDMDSDVDQLAEANFDEGVYDFGQVTEEKFDDSIFDDDPADRDGDFLGLLNREETARGMADLERKLGRHEVVSEVIGSTVTGMISENTQYPTVVLSEHPDLDDFFEVASMLHTELKPEDPSTDGHETGQGGAI